MSAIEKTCIYYNTFHIGHFGGIIDYNRCVISAYITINEEIVSLELLSKIKFWVPQTNTGLLIILFM